MAGAGAAWEAAEATVLEFIVFLSVCCDLRCLNFCSEIKYEWNNVSSGKTKVWFCGEVCGSDG